MPRAVRYRILRKIAHGGMAEIFLAMQTGAEGFQKPVVLKRILPAFAADPHFVRMLVDEAHIASTLNHSHLVQILDLGKSGGQFFLVLEFVDGWSLEQVRRRAQKARLKFPLSLTLYIVSSLCRALNYVHRRARDGKPLGIVHRDVSPQNVLLGSEGEVKLADFGIAKAAGRREKSATGIIKGKFAYMSPEQSIGSALDARSDLFSVGTLLYILTTGKKPFDAPTDLEVLMQVRRARFEKPTSFLKEFNPEVERFIGRALRADRSRRWQNAEQMADRLDAILVKLGQPSGPAALKRWLEALSERDGIKPPGELPDTENELGVGTIELETGDLELHDTASGEVEAPARARPARRRESSSPGLASVAAMAPEASPAPTSISATSYVSLSMVPDEEPDAAAPAAVLVSAPPAPVVAPLPITVLTPAYIPDEARPPEPTVRRPPLFVLGEPMFPLPRDEEEDPAADDLDDTEDDAATDADDPVLSAPEPTATATVETPPPEPGAAATLAAPPSQPGVPAPVAASPFKPVTPAPDLPPTIRYPIVFPPIRTNTKPSPLSRTEGVRSSTPAMGSRVSRSPTPLTSPAMPAPPAPSPSAQEPVTEVIPPPVKVAEEPYPLETPPLQRLPDAMPEDSDASDPDFDPEASDVEIPVSRFRRWRRRLLIAAATFTLVLSGLCVGAYYARAYVFPSWPPWAYARLIRPVEGWVRGLPARLHVPGFAQPRDQ